MGQAAHDYGSLIRLISAPLRWLRGKVTLPASTIAKGEACQEWVLYIGRPWYTFVVEAVPDVANKRVDLLYDYALYI